MKAQTYAQICLALMLIPSAAFAEPGEVFPRVVDGMEYQMRFGRQPRSGWQDGLKNHATREQCELRLKFTEPPTVCMVRKAPAPSLSI